MAEARQITPGDRKSLNRFEGVRRPARGRLLNKARLGANLAQTQWATLRVRSNALPKGVGQRLTVNNSGIKEERCSEPFRLCPQDNLSRAREERAKQPQSFCLITCQITSVLKAHLRQSCPIFRSRFAIFGRTEKHTLKAVNNAVRVMSDVGGRAENIYSRRVFPGLTHFRHLRPAKDLSSKAS